jgi:hypothetical protein
MERGRDETTGRQLEATRAKDFISDCEWAVRTQNLLGPDAPQKNGTSFEPAPSRAVGCHSARSVAAPRDHVGLLIWTPLGGDRSLARPLIKRRRLQADRRACQRPTDERAALGGCCWQWRWCVLRAPEPPVARRSLGAALGTVRVRPPFGRNNHHDGWRGNAADPPSRRLAVAHTPRCATTNSRTLINGKCACQ